MTAASAGSAGAPRSAYKAAKCRQSLSQIGSACPLLAPTCSIAGGPLPASYCGSPRRAIRRRAAVPPMSNSTPVTASLV
jgi:hypothetical protein